MSGTDTDVLRRAADEIERLAARTPPGRWTVRGLLASRPEVVAVDADGRTEHVAEARAASAQWIVTTAPAIAPSLVAWLRGTAEGPGPYPRAAVDLARAVLAAHDRESGGDMRNV
ncbi:hypothetical protein [Actinomycetospora termitidis]|uniref:Uncharacterized protein n=1 Tax=Actinomycetospora termitidis TaxID=3053470 RepID=A0ABT7MGP0_9PSEU|nr:hypothetical protein [Actinomycetospora sp. Odt1-22]MDL5159840.1 hypothetical protein [Actinomycetospora sp. Odt1-22]